MSEIATLERVLWGLTFLLNVAVVFLILYRKNYRTFLFFFVYALLNFLQSVALFETYRINGFGSPISARIAWASQGLVSISRGFAIAEVCRLVLARYRGVWKLAWRLLFVAGALIAFYAWAVSGGSWRSAILNLDRGIELAIASVIVLLFLFVRYFEIKVETTVRTIAIGFFLFSSFRVLNDTMWGRWLNHYAALWSLLGTLTFLASLLLWTWALRHTQPETTFAPELLPGDLYHSLSPEINARLRALNEQLSHFWYAEGKKT